MVSGTTLVGWILVTIAFAGLWGAVRNETWLSVLQRTVNPKRQPVKVRP